MTSPVAGLPPELVRSVMEGVEGSGAPARDDVVLFAPDEWPRETVEDVVEALLDFGALYETDDAALSVTYLGRLWMHGEPFPAPPDVL